MMCSVASEATPPLPLPRPPYRVSTLTCVSGLSCAVDLEALFERVRICPLDADGIVFSELSLKGQELRSRGARPPTSKAARRRGPHRAFDNQLTLVVCAEGAGNTNIKVFRNGNVQMTGARSAEHAAAAVDLVIGHARDAGLDTGAQPLTRAPLRVCLMNSDVRIGFQVRRDRLFRLLRAEACYRMTRVEYEPCVYPGVKVYFRCNDAVPTGPAGVCRCRQPCDGRGDGRGDGRCRSVLIAVFQSGHVIVTGGTSRAHLDAAYDFVARLVARHRDEFELVAS